VETIPSVWRSLSLGVRRPPMVGGLEISDPDLRSRRRVIRLAGIPGSNPLAPAISRAGYARDAEKLAVVSA
jgi:hypothetical protein